MSFETTLVLIKPDAIQRNLSGKIINRIENTGLKIVGLKIRKDISEWRKLGVLRVDGRDLPKRNLMGSLVTVNGTKSRVFLTYSNYLTILKWNRSKFFAIAVGMLAEKIGGK